MFQDPKKEGVLQLEGATTRGNTAIGLLFERSNLMIDLNLMYASFMKSTVNFDEIRGFNVDSVDSKLEICRFH